MKIRSLEAFDVAVGLRKPIRHASHVRHQNDTLIVRCELDDGSVGWGEGLPRPYVTGESIGSAWLHLAQTDFSQLADPGFAEPLEAVAALGSFQLADVEPDSDVSVRECFGNSVRCAIELSLLDACCRSVNCSMSDLLRSLPEAEKIRAEIEGVRYSGVVTAAKSAIGQYRSALRMRLFGFHHVKVKVSANAADDSVLLNRVRRVMGKRVDVRVDANESWRGEDVVSRLANLQRFDISCLEQPVSHAEVGVLAEVRRQIQIPLMLDESLCCHEDATRAIADGTCDLFNLRVSKCGGLVSCVRLAALAAEHGLGYQLGCLVGETGILSAAGRHFACSISDIRYLEGSYDRFIVRDAMTVADMTFGYGGRARSLSGIGLGVDVSTKKIRSISRRSLMLVSGQ